MGLSCERARKLADHLRHIYLLGRMRRHVHGPQVTAGGVEFSVWAPALERVVVSVRGREYPFEPGGDGWWSVFVPGARPGDRYSFALPDGRRLPDPATRRQPDGVHAASEV